MAINKQGIITSLNPAAERLTRLTKEGALGRFWMDVIIPTGLLEVVRSGRPEFGVKFQESGRQLNKELRTIVASFYDGKEDIIHLALYYLGKNDKRHGFEKVFSSQAVQPMGVMTDVLKACDFSKKRKLTLRLIH